jgi:hypothetical protein
LGDVGDRQQFLYPVADVLWRLEMCAHGPTLPLRTSAKSVHNERLSTKERAHYHDQSEAGLLGWVLADDDHFQEKVAALAAAPSLERPARAWEQARDYAPYDGPHRDFIAKLLLAAADASWKDPPSTIPAQRRTLLVNLNALGVWAEAPLEDADAQRVRARWDRLREGAHRVALYGAHKCINCEASLARDSRSGRSRRTHCSPCESRRDAASQREGMRDVLDAATGQRHTRRANRRAPAS